MHSTHLFLVIAIIGTLALAAPTRRSHNGPGKHSFRIHHKGRPTLSAHEALAHAYRKHGWDFKWDSSSSLQSTGDANESDNSTTGSSGGGEVTATPVQHDSAYIAPVNIGGQVLNLDFDTGSSDLWVFSTELAQGAGAGHTLFDASKSSSFVDYQGATWSTHYGDDSSASGSVGFDTVSIGGATVEKQCVELAEQTKGFESLRKSDGLVGLAFSSLNQVKPQPQNTFWENLLPQLDQPVFTADLDEKATGSYEFGTIDTSKFTGDIQYADLASNIGYWLVDSQTYSIGGSQRECQLCNPAVIDTGTSLLLADEDVVTAYYKEVEGAQYSQSTGMFSYPCSSELPDLGLAIGSGYTAVLKGSGLTYVKENGQCIGGLQVGATTSGSVQIFGDVFFKQFFVVFDGGNSRVGVAPKSAST
ncbi:aspartic peptidase domain-containing protein [Neohortaea acidophila]|uniref:Aspartic peptidase domain-containing protein n=1 Tax=Neohortaea acidophila TaxID=245834 RepID=A0A6A6PTG7_9PEZI|nr:aspartic peptidase domain-containing protein [Neohortaea acidophila]KAF2482981.1 aspartic peptidase domain-containing protein [Neohortaea acidophila]